MNVRKTLLILAAGLLMASAAFGQTPNFSKIVVLGDSLSSGYYGTSLNLYGQPKAYDNLISEAAGHPLTLPLISYPGIPIQEKLAGFDPVTGFPILKPVGETMGSLMNPTSQPTNLAVPGQTSVDCLTKKPAIPPSNLTDLILGFPSVYIQGHAPASQVGLGVQLAPTFVIIWIGANDVLGGAVTGNPNYTVPASAFAQIFPAIVGSMAQTGAKMVLANIPDVTVLPVLSKGSFLAAQGMPIAKFGMGPDDYATPYSHEHIKLILEGKDSGPLGPGEILHAADVPKIQAILEADNQVIAAVGAQFHAPVVDMHTIFNKIKKHGYKLPNGQVLTADYLGGLFGIDGTHPTTTGQAILAKEFTKTINAYYHTSLPMPNVGKANLSDPEGFAVPGALPINVSAEVYKELVNSPSLQQ
jgi:lysophospholipase L1-like esterase